VEFEEEKGPRSEHPNQINIFAPRPPRVMKNTIKESY